MAQTPRETPEASEAQAMGERPDLGRTPDALAEALSGSGMGSDTRAGSLRGGPASGSDIDPDQAEVDRFMAEQGRAATDPRPASSADPTPVENTGVAPGEAHDDTAAGRSGDQAEAPTG